MNWKINDYINLSRLDRGDIEQNLENIQRNHAMSLI